MNELVKRLTRLPADRRAELLALLREDTAGPGVSAVPVPCERGASGPLSFGQESIWFVSRFEPDQPTYNTAIGVRLTGAFDVSAWRRALAAVVARHEMLRTSVAEGPDGPVQTAQPWVPVDLPLIEVPGADAEQRRLAADGHLSELSRRMFALDTAPLWRAALLRMAEDEHLFVFVVHHVVFDGWSWGVVFTELADRYRAELAAPDAARVSADGMSVDEPDQPRRLEFGDYVRWQRDWLADGNLATLTDFWRDALAGAPVLEFPTDRPRPPVQSYRGGSRYRPLRLTTQEEVGRLARSLHTTPNVIYTAVFFALLHRYTGTEDAVIGAPSANREFTEIESVVGYFINMLVLRADISGDPTFRVLVDRVHTAVQQAFAHGSLPFGKLVEALRPDRDPSRAPIFQLVFAFQNAEREFTLPGLTTERLALDAGSSRYDMSWELTERTDGLELAVRYSTDLFDEATVAELMARYDNVLRAIVADPELPLSRISLLSDPEREELRERWNGPLREVPAVTVPELFARQVARHPEAVAVVAGQDAVTYAQLDRSANQLARLLRAAGAGPGRLVALCLPRRTELIVAMLAVMKSGAAYVPLDPTHPPARLATVLDDSAPAAVVTTGSTAGNLPDSAAPVIRFDTDRNRLAAEDPQPPPLNAGPHDLAYVLYTSGSTGTPKGVLIEHHSVVNFIAAMQEQFELTAADRILGYAASTFDVSVFEIFSALLTGARLYLATEDERLDPDRLQDLLVSCGITITDLPPTLMTLLDPERLPALRSVFVGLEAFPGELVNRWNRSRRFFNGYGPTECTVTMIVQECDGHWDGSPPIGLPIANHVAHVLDAGGVPVPVGVPGELVIGGTGLARGYLNRPELTAEKFYDDPFGTSPGGRLYRTGDLVKRRRDGALVFLGRIDHQVKIRGLRIELGEIESVLSRHPGVDQAAVEVSLDGRGEKHLVCYLAGPAAPPPPAQLRAFLADRLPAYMVPAQFVPLPALPLNSSGKVDRRRLPDPQEFVRPSDGPVGYAGELERTLSVEIVAPLLGLAPDQVDPERNFFELGGHSLAAARVLARVRSQFSTEVSLADFFLNPTVRGLADVVESRRRAIVGGEDELLAMLDAMTDDEAAALLADEPDEARP